MGRLFGTDGVRGVAGVDLTAELVRDLSAAAAQVLAGRSTPSVAVVGRDTRQSGPMLETAVVDGLTAAGVDVLVAGVLPTPAVAFLTAQHGADLGVMISASHNPAPDNGIKFFGAGGRKLDDATEAEIEAAMGASTPGARGSVHEADDNTRRGYVEHVVASLPRRPDGMRVVVDCANGAAGPVAAAVYSAAGADAVLINTETDGARINDRCGATHLATLQAAVTEQGADAGIAHDGDADRCLAVSADGVVVDGDQILAILATALHDKGELANDTVVTTVMANFGFKQAMQARGITVLETPVGDRYVLERMVADGLNLGGEQSGHLILRDHATTGDGLMTGLHVLSRMAETNQSLADLAAVMKLLPQVLIGVPVADKSAAMSSSELQAAVAVAESELGEAGRVLVRPSGTEPLIRVMVEAPDEGSARSIAERVAAAVN